MLQCLGVIMDEKHLEPLCQKMTQTVPFLRRFGLLGVIKKNLLFFHEVSLGTAWQPGAAPQQSSLKKQLHL